MASGTARPATTRAQVGDVIAGKYLIGRVVGDGGMGVVYEATHQRLRQRVAIKMLLRAMPRFELIWDQN